eukprot:267793_1
MSTWFEEWIHQNGLSDVKDAFIEHNMVQQNTMTMTSNNFASLMADPQILNSGLTSSIIAAIQSLQTSEIHSNNDNNSNIVFMTEEQKIILQEMNTYLTTMQSLETTAKLMENKYTNRIKTFRTKIDNITDTLSKTMNQIHSRLNAKEKSLRQTISEHRKQLQLDKILRQYQTSIQSEIQYFNHQITVYKNAISMNENKDINKQNETLWSIQHNTKIYYLNKLEELNNTQKEINQCPAIKCNENYDYKFQINENYLTQIMDDIDEFMGFNMDSDMMKIAVTLRVDDIKHDDDKLTLANDTLTQRVLFLSSELNEKQKRYSELETSLTEKEIALNDAIKKIKELTEEQALFRMQIDELTGKIKADNKKVKVDNKPEQKMNLDNYSNKKQVSNQKSSKHTEMKQGKNITTWVYYDKNKKRHEIVFKHTLKSDRNGKSKRVIKIDGKSKYSDKNKEIRFFVKHNSDKFQIDILHSNANESGFDYRLLINGVNVHNVDGKGGKRALVKNVGDQGVELKNWMRKKGVFDMKLYAALLESEIDTSMKIKQLKQSRFDAFARKFRADRFAETRDQKGRNHIDKMLIKFEKVWRKETRAK